MTKAVKIKGLTRAALGKLVARARTTPQAQRRNTITVRGVGTLGKTKTATQAGSKKKYYVVDDRAGSLTEYVRFQKSNIPRTMLKALKGHEPMVYNRNDKSIWTSSVGLQDFQDIMYFTPTNCGDMMSQAIASTGLSLNNLFTSGQGLGTADLFIMSLSATLRFTNLSNGVVEFDLYDWIARRDVYVDHANNSATPRDCFITGVGDQTTALIAQSTAYQQAGVSPFASKLFTMNYKVLRSRKIVLAPGQQHHHVVNIKPWFRINYELINNNNIVAIKKLTSGTSILYKGGIVKDNSGACTFANSEIGVVATYQYKFKFVPVNWRREYIVNSLSTAVAATNNFENLVKGAVDTYATA